MSSHSKNKPRNLPAPNHQPPRGVVVRTETQSVQFQGPLPPPAILKEYDNVIPGGAERILAMAEKQQAHRQDLEKSVIESGVARETEGARFGFILYLASIIAGTWLISSGKDVVGLIELLTTTAAFAGLFVYSREAKKKELKKKLEPEPNSAPKAESLTTSS